MSSRRRERRVKARACAAHVGYESREAANTRRLILDTGHLNVWRCRLCGKWHVGHQPGWVQRRLTEGRR